jgi:hypothetical protein
MMDRRTWLTGSLALLATPLVAENIAFEGRYYGDRVEQLPGFAAELVRLQVDVIVAAAAPAPEAARHATATIP